MSASIAWPATRKPQTARAVGWLGLPIVQKLLLLADGAYDLGRKTVKADRWRAAADLRRPAARCCKGP